MTKVDFSGVPYLEDNPFLFPCAVGGLFNLFTLVFVSIYLPETYKPHSDEGVRIQPLFHFFTLKQHNTTQHQQKTKKINETKPKIAFIEERAANNGQR